MRLGLVCTALCPVSALECRWAGEGSWGASSPAQGCATPSLLHMGAGSVRGCQAGSSKVQLRSHSPFWGCSLMQALRAHSNLIFGACLCCGAQAVLGQALTSCRRLPLVATEPQVARSDLLWWSSVRCVVYIAPTSSESHQSP